MRRLFILIVVCLLLAATACSQAEMPTGEGGNIAFLKVETLNEECQAILMEMQSYAVPYVEENNPEIEYLIKNSNLTDIFSDYTDENTDVIHMNIEMNPDIQVEVTIEKTICQFDWKTVDNEGFNYIVQFVYSQEFDMFGFGEKSLNPTSNNYVDE